MTKRGLKFLKENNESTDSIIKYKITEESIIEYCSKLKKSKMNELNINSRDSENYYYYKQINFDSNYKLFSDLYLLKRKDTSYIIKERNSGINIYLSDYEIILLLAEIRDNYRESFNFIVNESKKVVDNKGQVIRCYIDKQEFKFQGLSLEEKEVLISTKADIAISINDIIMLINLIIEKERISSEKMANGTLGKYILFAIYLSKNTEESERNQLKVFFEKESIDLSNIKKSINSNGKSKKSGIKILIKSDDLKTYI